MFFLFCLLSSSMFAQILSPSVVQFPAADTPIVPPGLKVTCLTNPDSLTSNSACPVIVWNEYVYWVYSFIDNRDAMSIMAYTEDGTMVKRWDKPGARYITKISVDQNAKTITLIGQSKKTIVVKWDELYLPIPPEAGKVPSSVHPAIPAGSDMVCMQSTDVVGKMDTCFVLQWRDYTYWAYSYIDNRVAMNIVAYDLKGTIVKQWSMPGARYLYKITVDPAAQTVTFWGQVNQSITMKWIDLMI